MSSPAVPRLAKLLLAAMVASFVAAILRDVFGYAPPVLLHSWWDKAYNATEFFAAAACAVRAARTTGPERAAWIAFSVGLGAFFAGDVYWTAVLETVDSPPFPSPSDAGYLAIYPASYVGLVLLLRARAGRMSPALWLDGLITALAVAAVGAALVLGVVASTEGSLATVATNLAYPLGDLALLAFVFAVITVTGWRPGRTWLFIAAGFAVFAVADTIYLYQAALGTYDEYGILDLGWPGAYVLVAFAAWQRPTHIDARPVLRGWAMLLLPAGATLAALGLLLVDHYTRTNQLAVWLASAALLVGVARFMLTFRANLRMLQRSEREATTDALTGLGNRRALTLDLEHAAAGGIPQVLALFDLDGFKSYNDAFGHVAGDVLLERLGSNLATAIAGHGTAYRMGGDEFCVLARVGDTDPSEVVARAATALGEHGGRFRVGCSYGMVLLDGERIDPSEALRLADQRMYANKRGGRQTSEETVHQVLLSVVGEHDGALRDHVDDVARLAEQVGRRLGLDDGDVAHLRRAAALHDVGKIAIPDDILHAPRALSPEEWGYMRQHTVIGARIIAAAPELLPVADIVRSSHERWDGDGYPDRLAGDAIPLGARIVAVCDSFDAMTTDRAYRAAMAVDDAIAELERCAGSQFDPQVVSAFRAVLAAEASAPAGDGDEPRLGPRVSPTAV
jgi:diguanylate cyclase (GGDEF)-like protein/putative nucleotidyltransferase with HDIG domain